MSKWREMKLLDVTDFIDGDRGKNYPKQFEYLDDGYCLFLNTSNVNIEGFNFDKINYVSKEKDKVLRKGKLEYNDLILTTRGTIGNIAYYKEGMFSPMRINSSMLILRVNNDIVSQSFIYYLMKTKSFREYMNLYSSGSAQPQLPVKDLRQIKIQIPDLKTQEKIADILSTYDKLIENNNRRIQVLEKTAEEIYKEWFVRMRFPGYENSKFIKGIPEGWEVRKLKTLSKLVHGYTESANEMEIGPKYLRGTDINKNSYINWEEVPYCEIDKNMIKKYKLYKNDMVIIRMADPGKVAIVEKNIEAVFASYLIKIDYDEDKIKPYYIFYTLYSEGYQNHIKSFSSGTTRSSINSKMILNSKILVPTNRIQEEFNESIKIHREMINKLLDENQNLIKQRDLLLPRLMNGTIEVN